MTDGPIALVDYGAGNLRSVENALGTVGARVEVTHDPEVVRRAGRIVVPGQGSMPACAQAMRASGVAAALTEAVARGASVLGICVGLQVLFEKGEEGGGEQAPFGIPASRSISAKAAWPSNASTISRWVKNLSSVLSIRGA